MDVATFNVAELIALADNGDGTLKAAQVGDLTFPADAVDAIRCHFSARSTVHAQKLRRRGAWAWAVRSTLMPEGVWYLLGADGTMSDFPAAHPALAS